MHEPAQQSGAQRLHPVQGMWRPPSATGRGGWILGNLVDDTQAEYVRVPHADTSLYSLPTSAVDEEMVMLSDVLPTGFECGVRKGRVQPGSTVAIVGAGPVGIAALLSPQLFSRADVFVIDVDNNRLEMAKAFGATKVINSKDAAARDIVMSLAGNRGVDVAIEAVGTPSTFDPCQGIVAPGGTIANIGVHGVKVELHLEQLWDRNITITTGLVDTSSTQMLMDVIRARRIEPKRLITHRFKLDKIEEAYETFANAATTLALKVLVEI